MSFEEFLRILRIIPLITLSISENARINIYQLKIDHRIKNHIK